MPMRGRVGRGENVKSAQAAISRGANVVVWKTGDERRNDELGGVAGGDGVGEDAGLGAEGVECGERETGIARVKDLVVGEFVEDDPQNTRVVRWWVQVRRGCCGVVEMAGLVADPKAFCKQYAAQDRRE